MKRIQPKILSPSERNLTPVIGKVTRQDRERKNGHQGAVVWLTGLPAAGKTTIAIELEYWLTKNQIKSFILDGDNIRSGLSSDLDFTPDGRRENMRRVGEVAKLFCDAGFIVISAFIAPFREKRNWIRSILPAGRFIEVHVDCELAECEKRDPKHLYEKARRGQIANFTGVSLPYEKPLSPEIYLNTKVMTVQECVERIIGYLKHKRLIPDPGTITENLKLKDKVLIHD